MDEDDYTPAVTPVQAIDGGMWLKRDDLFSIAGVRGGKVRACWTICTNARDRGGLVGVVTASHRPSPQGHIVAAVARRLGVPCRVHTPKGEFTDQMNFAAACGAEIFQHKLGYNNVIIKRATDDALQLGSGWLHVPFGMESRVAVQSVSDEVRNLPAEARRLVVPVGSGISLSGILRGLREWKIDLPVLGVMSGANSVERLDRHAPPDWRSRVTLVPSGVDYHRRVDAVLGGVRLDPVYEAKCVKFLIPGDVLWCVGIRAGIPS